MELQKVQIFQKNFSWHWQMARVFSYTFAIFAILMTWLRDMYFFDFVTLMDILLFLGQVIILAAAAALLHKRFAQEIQRADIFLYFSVLGFFGALLYALFLFFWELKVWAFINIIGGPLNWAIISSIIGFLLYYGIFEKNIFSSFVVFWQKRKESKSRNKGKEVPQKSQEKEQYFSVGVMDENDDAVRVKVHHIE